MHAQCSRPQLTSSSSLQRARCRLAASSARLQQVIAAIDKLNSEDPRQHAYNGRTHPYELIYSQWVTEWVHKLAAEPSEELQIAARGQHVRRWTSPRSSYPEVRWGLHCCPCCPCSPCCPCCPYASAAPDELLHVHVSCCTCALTACCTACLALRQTEALGQVRHQCCWPFHAGNHNAPLGRWAGTTAWP